MTTGTIYLIAAIATIIQCLVLLHPYFLKQYIVSHVANEPRLFNLFSLRITNERKSTWSYLKKISLAVSSLALLLMLAIIALFVISKAPVTWNVQLVFLLILSIGLPIILIADDIISDRRLKRGLHSRVFSSSELKLFGSYESLFSRSMQVTASMGAIFIDVNKSLGILSSELGQTTILIGIKPIAPDYYHLTISVDSNLPSTRWDFGKNQRIVDELSKRLLGLI